MTRLELVKKQREAVSSTEEYFNAICMNIQLKIGDGNIIAINSIEDSQNLEDVALKLSMSFARAGYKIVLLDTDVRQSTLFNYFVSPHTELGLTDYLSNEVSLTSILSETDIPQFTVIQSGSTTSNPIGLLQSERFKELLHELSQSNDYVIVKSPPLGHVVDAVLTTRECDASLLVLQSGVTKREVVRQTVTQLEQTGVPFLGVVLDKYDTSFSSGTFKNYGNPGVK